MVLPSCDLAPARHRRRPREPRSAVRTNAPSELMPCARARRPLPASRLPQPRRRRGAPDAAASMSIGRPARRSRLRSRTRYHVPAQLDSLTPTTAASRVKESPKFPVDRRIGLEHPAQHAAERASSRWVALRIPRVTLGIPSWPRAKPMATTSRPTSSAAGWANRSGLGRRLRPDHGEVDAGSDRPAWRRHACRRQCTSSADSASQERPTRVVVAM
jgi:hypothetical protein